MSTDITENKMNILFLDAYFDPEVIAYSHLEKDLLSALVEDRNQIQVICPLPTRGISENIRKKYKNKKKEIMKNGRIVIRRFWAPQERKNPVIRAIRYFWCNLQSYYIAGKCKNIDAVFSNSTPPTQGMLGAMVAKKLSKKYGKKVPFIYNLQDIFPDSLVSTGLTRKGSFFWKIGSKIEHYTYKNADKIIVISESFKRNIRVKGVPEKKIEVISNWIDLNSVYPVSRENNKLINELSLNPQNFLVVYAGNFGAAQGADIILKVAEKMLGESQIQFIVFGGGSEFDEAVQYVKDNKLTNVIIYPLLSQDRIAEVYSLGDLSLITCKVGVGNSGMPSKTWSIMACNTPIVAAFDKDSDLARILKESSAGICVDSGKELQIVDAIMRIKTGNYKYSSGRDYVRQNASKEICVKKYINLFYNICENR